MEKQFSPTIELAQETYQELTERNPFSKLLGLEVVEVAQGHLIGKLPFRRTLQNLYGDFHGGAILAAADTFCGLAAFTYGNFVSTIDANIQYLRAGRDTEFLLYDAQVVKAGKNIIVVHFESRDDQGNLTNIGTLSYFVKESD